MSSESTFKSIALVGVAGSIGQYIYDALITKPDISLLILTRPISKPLANLPSNVSAESVWYHDKEAVAEALKKHGVEVVIIALGQAGMMYKGPLAEGAKLAGVKLFVPSEYGSPTDGQPAHTPLFGEKYAFSKFLTSIDLPWARFFVGMFVSWVPLITGKDANGKVNIIGEGKAPITWTADEDIGGFIAHVLTTLPPSQLTNRQFRIQGEEASLTRIAGILKLPINRLNTKDPVPGDTFGIPTYIQMVMNKGTFSTGFDKLEEKVHTEGDQAAGSANKLWEGHVWKKINDFYW